MTWAILQEGIQALHWRPALRRTRDLVAWDERRRGEDGCRSARPWLDGSIESHTVRGLDRVELRPALTFHCREIPSWLVGQQGYSQVDKLKGGRDGGGEKSRMVVGANPKIKLDRKREWRLADASFTLRGASYVGLVRARVRNR